MNVSCVAEIIWYCLPRFEVSPVVLSGTRPMTGESS